MVIVNGACTKCGCAEHECECLTPEEISKAEATDKVEEFCLAIEHKLDPLEDGREGTKHNPWICFDCHKSTDSYMVDMCVWEEAWPTYDRDRRLIRHRYATMYPQFHEPSPKVGVARPMRGKGTGGFLCLPCLEDRLGRALAIEDFTKAKVNNSIRFAFMMGVDAERAAVKKRAEEAVACVSQQGQRTNG